MRLLTTEGDGIMRYAVNALLPPEPLFPPDDN